MKIVVALGGNALLQRGQELSAKNQLISIRAAAIQLASIASGHDLLITHGNGPQIGLLALQAESYKDVAPYPLDMLGAQTQGSIGYLIEQELANRLPASRQLACLVTRTVINADDPELALPSKPVGPMYAEQEAKLLASERHWSVASDDSGYRRVVPSPTPLVVTNLEAIRCLFERGFIVIAAGGGGIPVVNESGQSKLHGVEAVIDKDATSTLLAIALKADCLLIATGVEAVFSGWGTTEQHAIGRIAADKLQAMPFPRGSMAPKVKAACEFVNQSCKRAVIGSLHQIEAMLAGSAGTQIIVSV
jgi:carbamate kinase